MIVVPESMMVSKPDTAMSPPEEMFTSITCQNLVMALTSWNSIGPVYYTAGLVPLRKISEPDEAR